MNKTDKTIFKVGLILLIIVSVIIILQKPDTKTTTPKNELKIEKTVDDPVVNDTTIVEQKGDNLWPIKVTSVERGEDPKWKVTTENGVMYYTNTKPKVGDIAFYINDNDDITDKNGRVEITRR